MADGQLSSLLGPAAHETQPVTQTVYCPSAEQRAPEQPQQTAAETNQRANAAGLQRSPCQTVAPRPMEPTPTQALGDVKQNENPTSSTARQEALMSAEEDNYEQEDSWGDSSSASGDDCGKTAESSQFLGQSVPPTMRTDNSEATSFGNRAVATAGAFEGGLDLQLGSQLSYQEGAIADAIRRTTKKKSKGGRIASEIAREELAQYFNMPSEEAAKRLGVGLTVLKRICRRYGVSRWPYRKLKSLDRLIQNVETGVAPGETYKHLMRSAEDIRERQQAMKEGQISDLDDSTKKLQQAYSKFNHKLRKAVHKDLGAPEEVTTGQKLEKSAIDKLIELQQATGLNSEALSSLPQHGYVPGERGLPPPYPLHVQDMSSAYGIPSQHLPAIMAASAAAGLPPRLGLRDLPGTTSSVQGLPCAPPVHAAHKESNASKDTHPASQGKDSSSATATAVSGLTAAAPENKPPPKSEPADVSAHTTAPPAWPSAHYIVHGVPSGNDYWMKQPRPPSYYADHRWPLHLPPDPSLYATGHPVGSAPYPGTIAQGGPGAYPSRPARGYPSPAVMQYHHPYTQSPHGYPPQHMYDQYASWRPASLPPEGHDSLSYQAAKRVCTNPSQQPSQGLHPDMHMVDPYFPHGPPPHLDMHRHPYDYMQPPTSGTAHGPASYPSAMPWPASSYSTGMGPPSDPVYRSPGPLGREPGAAGPTSTTSHPTSSATHHYKPSQDTSQATAPGAPSTSASAGDVAHAEGRPGMLTQRSLSSQGLDVLSHPHPQHPDSRPGSLGKASADDTHPRPDTHARTHATEPSTGQEPTTAGGGGGTGDHAVHEQQQRQAGNAAPAIGIAHIGPVHTGGAGQHPAQHQAASGESEPSDEPPPDDTDEPTQSVAHTLLHMASAVVPGPSSSHPEPTPLAAAGPVPVPHLVPLPHHPPHLHPEVLYPPPHAPGAPVFSVPGFSHGHHPHHHHPPPAHATHGVTAPAGHSPDAMCAELEAPMFRPAPVTAPEPRQPATSGVISEDEALGKLQLCALQMSRLLKSAKLSPLGSRPLPGAADLGPVEGEVSDEEALAQLQLMALSLGYVLRDIQLTHIGRPIDRTRNAPMSPSTAPVHHSATPATTTAPSSRNPASASAADHPGSHFAVAAPLPSSAHDPSPPSSTAPAGLAVRLAPGSPDTHGSMDEEDSPSSARWAANHKRTPGSRQKRKKSSKA